MRLRLRLKRLEQARPSESAIWLVCVDEQGRILDDGSDQIRPWIGKHYSTVPGTPQVIVGVDPLMVLGRRVTGSR
jgi:hypothetical protein